MSPPRLARWILRRLLPAVDREAHLADLEELHALRAASRGPWAAHRWYWRQVWTSSVYLARRRGGLEPARTAAQQIRQSLRALARAPGFTLTAVLTLALGLGATVAVFSVVHAVLLQALPYPDADRLVLVHTDAPPNRWPLSVADYVTLEDRNTALDAFGAVTSRSMTYQEEGGAVRVLASLVTPSLLPTLGVEPALGRGFAPEEGTPGAPRVVIVSHAFWQSRLGGASDVLERTVRLDGEAYRIVGVMGPDVGPLEGSRADVWPALQLEPPLRKGPFFLRVVGRLKPGISLAAANGELQRLNREMFPRWADSYADQRATWGAVPALEWVAGDVRPVLLVLFGGSLLVLLMAVTNVANLVVSRATVRAREVEVRAALGASPSRLVAFHVAETLILALASGAAGLVLAYAGVDLLTQLAPSALPRVQEIGLDPEVLAYTLAVAVGTGLLLGIAPGLGTRAAGDTSALRTGTRGYAGGKGSRLRGVLVAAQLAVALPLLVGAGLLRHSLSNLLDVDAGFAPDRVLSFQLSLAPARYPEPADVDAFWDRLRDDLNALPGVEAVGLNSSRPPRELDQSNNFALAVRRTPAGESDPGAPWIAADPGFFQALGVPLLAGRLHASGERALNELVVDEQWVRRHVPVGVDPLGLRLVSGPCTAQAEPEPPCAWQTVVGVVGTVRYTGLDHEDHDGAVYFSQRTSGYRNLFVYLGGDGVSDALLSGAREVVRRLDPEVAVTNVAAGRDLLTAAVARPRYLMTLFGAFAGVALALAGIGVYGVMSYFVSRHTRDIGIRVALGGRRTEVVATVMGRALRLALSGLTAGVAVTIVLSRFLEGLLFGVSATDAPTFVAMAAGLAVVAAVACWIPARRATRVDPLVALRAD